MFLHSLGQTSITVFPYIRQHKSFWYDSAAAARIAAFLRTEGFAGAVLSDTGVPISGTGRMNQSRMFRESSREFVAYLQANRIQTRYALMTEYLMTGDEGVGGISRLCSQVGWRGGSRGLTEFTSQVFAQLLRKRTRIAPP